MEGQYSIFDYQSETEKRRPCGYSFKRYIGQKVRFNQSCGDGGVHTITEIEKYYTFMDDGMWVGTPTTIHPVREE